MLKKKKKLFELGTKPSLYVFFFPVQTFKYTVIFLFWKVNLRSVKIMLYFVWNLPRNALPFSKITLLIYANELYLMANKNDKWTPPLHTPGYSICSCSDYGDAINSQTFWWFLWSMDLTFTYEYIVFYIKELLVFFLSCAKVLYYLFQLYTSNHYLWV